MPPSRRVRFQDLRRALFRLCLGAAAIILLLPVPVQAGDILVFAASSQRDALDAVIEVYRRTSKAAVRVSYQSSSTLARQIEQGAPADLYISASPQWMDYLEERKLIDAQSRVNIVGNGLVLVAAKNSTARPARIGPGFDLAERLGAGRLAVGDPDHVPGGIYAKQALKRLGMWQQIEPKLARADNIRSALALVARGETPYGIVYSSDAMADASVKVIGHFPQHSHLPIVYPAAVTANAKDPQAARDFLAFLRQARAAAIYRRYGFRSLDPATN